jgi:molecular chaperone DnaK (HSP70)
MGIDFGASFSTAAVFMGDRVHFALDGRGEACIPSAVYFPPKGAPVVGAGAAVARSNDPADVVVGFKRLLGHAYDSPARTFADAISAIKLKKGHDGEIRIKTVQGEHSPTEVASMVMRELKALVETRFRTKFERVVVTAPARASAGARQETAMAARLAGFKTVELLPEPVAAALSFGLAKTPSDRRFLVYDFGGGTFDSTVVAQRENDFDVFAHDGDECLGGDNFDAELARWVAGEMWRTVGRDPTKDRILWDRVVRLSELGKRALSSAIETTIRIDDGDVRGPTAIKVSRTVVESIWRELVERSIATSARTVVAAGSRPSDLAGVMLVGGTTFVPMIQSRVKEVFRIPCGWSADAQTAVAAGAALFGAGRLSVAAGWES